MGNRSANAHFAGVSLAFCFAFLSPSATYADVSDSRAAPQTVLARTGLVSVGGRNVLVGRELAAELAECQHSEARIEGTDLASGAMLAVEMIAACTATDLHLLNASDTASSAVSPKSFATADDLVLIGVQGIVGTGVQGIVGTSVQGIVGTGVQGIVGTGVQGIVGTGVQGIVGTGVQGIVGTGVQGIVGTGLQGKVGTSVQGVFGTGEQAIVATGVH